MRMKTTAACAGVIFLWEEKIKSTIFKTRLIFSDQHFHSLPKDIYPCGIIMYCTTSVPKLNQF